MNFRAHTYERQLNSPTNAIFWELHWPGGLKFYEHRYTCPSWTCLKLRWESAKNSPQVAQGHQSSLIRLLKDYFQWHRSTPKQYPLVLLRQNPAKIIPVGSPILVLHHHNIPGPPTRIPPAPYLPSSPHSHRLFHWNYIVVYYKWIKRRVLKLKFGPG